MEYLHRHLEILYMFTLYSVATKIGVTFLHIAKRCRCFYKKFEDRKVYLIKWRHRIQYFVQLSLFITIVQIVTANFKL
jgi:hypothetical protein